MYQFIEKRLEDSAIFSQQQIQCVSEILGECSIFSAPFKGLETAYLQQRHFKDSFDLIVSCTFHSNTFCIRALLFCM